MYSASPRVVSGEQATEIFASLGPLVSTVVVTHTHSEEDLREILSLRPSAVQMYHDLTVPRGTGVKVFRALKTGDPPRSDCDAIVIDESRGAGTLFDLAYAREVVKNSAVPVILAGGLRPGNVREAIARVNPYAVDVSSGVEKRPGVKDRKKVYAFVQACRGL
jgi:phosphoribosylanthranilate isomerase